MKPANPLSSIEQRRVPLQTAVMLPLLLLFVRWGAAEQLFILIGLASIARTAPATSKLDKDRNQTLRWLAVGASALACARDAGLDSTATVQSTTGQTNGVRRLRFRGHFYFLVHDERFLRNARRSSHTTMAASQ
jgi:hypothetical protein